MAGSGESGVGGGERMQRDVDDETRQAGTLPQQGGPKRKVNREMLKAPELQSHLLSLLFHPGRSVRLSSSLFLFVFFPVTLFLTCSQGQTETQKVVNSGIRLPATGTVYRRLEDVFEARIWPEIFQLYSKFLFV